MPTAAPADHLRKWCRLLDMTSCIGAKPAVKSSVPLINLLLGCGYRQVYGFGYSEEFIGDFMRKTGAQPQIATKYAPLPWRFTSGSVVDACKCGCRVLLMSRRMYHSPTRPQTRCQ